MCLQNVKFIALHVQCPIPINKIIEINKRNDHLLDFITNLNHTRYKPVFKLNALIKTKRLFSNFDSIQLMMMISNSGCGETAVE